MKIIAGIVIVAAVLAAGCVWAWYRELRRPADALPRTIDELRAKRRRTP